jgi:beta-glucosidase
VVTFTKNDIADNADPHGVTWTAAYSKANAALAKLSNTEKVGIVTGQGWQKGPCVGNTKAVSKVGLPSLCLQDGPVGVRYAMGITVLPAGVHAASTWDPELMHQRGLALGQEAKGLGIHIQLGPVAGPLGKIPHGGRNWEGSLIHATEMSKRLRLSTIRILS